MKKAAGYDGLPIPVARKSCAVPWTLL